MTETNVLKKCPFCGGEARITPYGYANGFIIEHQTRYDKSAPLCPIGNDEGEGTGVIYYETEQEAIQAWNKRTPEERSDPMTEQDFKELTTAVKESGIPLDLQKILQRLVDEKFYGTGTACKNKMEDYREIEAEKVMDRLVKGKEVYCVAIEGNQWHGLYRLRMESIEDISEMIADINTAFYEEA